MTTSTDDILRQVTGLIESGEVMRAQELLHNLHRQPNRRTAKSLLLLAAAHEAQNELDEASQLTEEAARLTTKDSDAAQLYERAADLTFVQKPLTRHAKERIVGLLTRSVLHDPTTRNAASRRKLATTLFALKRYEDLLAHSVALVNHPEDRSQARIWVASACFFLNKKLEGEPHLAAALEEPSALDDKQLFKVLTLAIEYGLLEQADHVLNWMKSERRAGNFRSEFAARIAREHGEIPKSLNILTEDYVNGMDHAASRQRLLALRGKCLDAVGRYAEAHRCFVDMNQIAREEWDHQPDPHQLKKLEQAILRMPPEPAGVVRCADEYTPTFLVGFPRSGTTLLESILDTHSRIRTLSETDTVSAITQNLKSKGGSYPEDVPHLDAKAIESLRRCYYDCQSQFVNDIAGKRIVIDKLPLNILHIPLFKTLFPGAKFILALRHPADVCISCFQQDFSLNSEMIHFTNFEGCFRRYRDVFKLFERYRTRLNLEVFTVRYEDLTTDLDNVAIGLFDFLGLAPEEEYRRFFLINRERLTNTPSRGQITKPLYQSSQYRWLNYAEFVRPMKAIIEDVASGYGYSLDESARIP